MTDDPKRSMEVTPDSTPCVPVFNCVVYVGRDEDGVRARVANLAGMACVASDERAALGKLVKDFKQHLAETLAAGKQPDWIEPLPAHEPHEQTRWIPVHL